MTAAGKGLVGVILPDTTTSARYTSYDLPYLTQAFTAAGYAATDFKIDNAAGTTTTELAIAQADITAGAKVLLVDPLDGTTGNQIQAAAAAAGVTMISYDRATFQGTNTYYVSFDNVQVGKLIGEGFMQCLTDWGVASPKVFTLDGGQDTDPNAIDFAKGYNSAIWGQKVAQVTAGATNSAGMTLVGEQLAPGWDNAKGGTIFQQAYTAHQEINATVEANDGLAGAVITVLKAAGVPAKKIPTTGQDATPPGHGERPPGLAVRLGLQADLPRGPGGRRPGHHPARRPDAARSPAQRNHHRSEERRYHRAGRPADPGLGQRREHGGDGHHGQVRSVTELCAAVGADVCTAAGIK